MARTSRRCCSRLTGRNRIPAREAVLGEKIAKPKGPTKWEFTPEHPGDDMASFLTWSLGSVPEGDRKERKSVGEGLKRDEVGGGQEKWRGELGNRKKIPPGVAGGSSYAPIRLKILATPKGRQR